MMICKNCGVEGDVFAPAGIITVIEEVDDEKEEFVFCSYKCMLGWFGQ